MLFPIEDTIYCCFLFRLTMFGILKKPYAVSLAVDFPRYNCFCP